MTAIIALRSTSLALHNYHVFLVVGIIKFKSHSKFGDPNTILLSIFIIWCIRSLVIYVSGYYLLLIANVHS